MEEESLQERQSNELEVLKVGFILILYGFYVFITVVFMLYDYL